MDNLKIISSRILSKEKKNGNLLVRSGFSFLLIPLLYLLYLKNIPSFETSIIIILWSLIGLIGILYGIIKLQYSTFLLNVYSTQESLILEKIFENNITQTKRLNWNQIQKISIIKKSENKKNKILGIVVYFEYHQVKNYVLELDIIQIEMKFISPMIPLQEDFASQIFFEWLIRSGLINVNKEDSFSKQNFFHCQLGKERHPYTKTRYTCSDCERSLCIDCFKACNQVGRTGCPFCDGTLRKNKIIYNNIRI